MIYFLVSILILTVIFAFLQKSKIITVCPICAGVVITWLMGIFGIYTSQTWANPLLVAILLGASLGALADKYGPSLGLFWKTFIILTGLPAIYYLIEKQFWIGWGLTLAFTVFTLIWSKRKTNHKPQDKDIFKECC